MIGVPASEASKLCASAFSARTLNSATGTVAEVRSLTVGPGIRVAAHAFPGVSGSEVIAWCWTGGPGHFVLYAVADGHAPVKVEGLSGPNATQTPQPGPPPIP